MSTLNNRRYHSDCSFNKFVIEVLNPEHPPCKHDLFEACKCFGKISLRMIKYITIKININTPKGGVHYIFQLHTFFL